MRKADSMCDELRSSLFDFLTFCSRRGHTLLMGSFYATFPSLCIHFAGCLIIASHKKYSCVAYFGNYQRTSVSIEIYGSAAPG